MLQGKLIGHRPSVQKPRAYIAVNVMCFPWINVSGLDFATFHRCAEISKESKTRHQENENNLSARP